MFISYYWTKRRSERGGALETNLSLFFSSSSFFFFLLLLFALLCVFIKDITEIIPTTLRNENGITKISLDLRNGDVPSLGIFLTREEKVFVLDTNVSGLRRL